MRRLCDIKYWIKYDYTRVWDILFYFILIKYYDYCNGVKYDWKITYHVLSI